MIHGIAKINEIPMLNSILIFIISFTLYQSLFPTYWENKAVPIIVVEAIIPISISVYAFAYDNAWLPPVMLIDIKLSTKEFKAKRNTENCDITQRLKNNARALLDFCRKNLPLGLKYCSINI